MTINEELLSLCEDANRLVIALVCGLPEADPAVTDGREWLERAKQVLFPEVRAALYKATNLKPREESRMTQGTAPTKGVEGESDDRQYA